MILRPETLPPAFHCRNQGLVQVFEAAVTGLEPGKPYLLALATEPSGTGVLEPLQGFMTNPAGAAVASQSHWMRREAWQVSSIWRSFAKA
jgi:hypothetical protein